MKSCVYIETSIPSYLTGRPSRDLIVAGWQQITAQWWDECRQNYDLYTSELVVAEASSGNPEAAERRLYSLKDIHELLIDDEVEDLASKLIENRAVPATAKADAIHIAVAAVQKMDYFLTWNCRHINNATKKPVIRKVCADFGYICPEICTPLELLIEVSNDL
ncbi:hypothetical protein BuS5_02853 [Desulfosarcina sp. BuS5]|uniref:type II toxin-antitoxin system VapC family toxin n=1 Tax=Desulfosarcina sp. BuS5 TaxID=933262 RepID=UPI000484193A|nr:type II toxin-antitoxin system VapC family toxin [Desulfosarcina sp. BuS5]WDN89885.1 hypothetical protein BuS5_02853 [Desulfosarcina sp. BuS5]